jgi:hypothetical protein
MPTRPLDLDFSTMRVCIECPTSNLICFVSVNTHKQLYMQSVNSFYFKGKVAHALLRIRRKIDIVLTFFVYYEYINGEKQFRSHLWAKNLLLKKVW